MKKSLLILASLCTANAFGAVLFADDFEGRTLGVLGGQLPWDAFSDVQYVVQNSVVAGGAQAVQVDMSAVANGSRWGWPNLSPEYDTAASAEKLVICQVEILHTTGSGMTFGIDCYQASPFARVGAMRVLNTDGTIQFVTGTTATPSTTTIAADSWNRFYVIADFGHNRMVGFVNGKLVDVTAAFVGTPTKVGDMDFYTTKATGGTGTGFFDNYSVSSAKDVCFGFNVLEGELFDGDERSFLTSDDNGLAIFNDPSTLAASIEFMGLTSQVAPNTVTWTLEASVARPGLQQELAMKNQLSGIYQVVGGSVATTFDSVSSVTVNGGTYVGAEGQIASRVRWSPINDEDPSQDGWLHTVDQSAYTTP
ncbi:MAG TPA: hypothetical protein PKA27_00735 [Fimbriimonadaceae bacterium]|nr:hypothetical protein [Fimbriimonadaceae bacterium]